VFTIFGMNQIEPALSQELFRLISENVDDGRTPVQYFAVGIDQRDRIGALFNQRPKALE
jgi:hypothetical protein